MGSGVPCRTLCASSPAPPPPQAPSAPIAESLSEHRDAPPGGQGRRIVWAKLAGGQWERA